MDITSLRFQNFKALRDFSVSLSQMNVLVGPNNAGKSTIIGAFRVLATALRRARAKSPTICDFGSQGFHRGYQIDPEEVPVSIENAHTDYGTGESSVTFKLSTGDSLLLHFPEEGGCRMRALTANREPDGPKAFRTRIPLTLGVIPVLGPVEHEEPLLQKSTVQAALSTHRASRHFRNYWYHFPEEFGAFAELVGKTWPEMRIARPEIGSGVSGVHLTMFCDENRIARELYWVGSGSRFGVNCSLTCCVHGRVTCW